jgi:hypothetical protein
VGPKNDSTNDRNTSPPEEQVFGVIPLVPLFTISIQYYSTTHNRIEEVQRYTLEREEREEEINRDSACESALLTK